MRVSRENEDDRQNILLNRASALSSSPEVVTQTVHDKKVGWSNSLSSSRIIIKKSTWKLKITLEMYIYHTYYES